MHSFFRAAPRMLAAVASRSAPLVAAVALSAALSTHTTATNLASHAQLQHLDDIRESSGGVPAAAAYEEAMALLWKEPEQVDVVWRAARAAYDLSQAAGTPKARQKELLEQALKLIRDAKNKERNDGAIYRWSGIILSAAGAFQGTTEYIKNAFVVRDDWEQATFINSYDATAVHLLGRWHFDVANMSWLTRKAASTFFAEPPSATFAEALEYFMRAESLNPGFWKANQYMLAQTHAKMGNKEEAVKWALSAIRLPVLSEEDAKTHAEVEAMLKATDSAAWATWQAEKAKREELRQAAVSAEAHRLGAGVPRK